MSTELVTAISDQQLVSAAFCTVHQQLVSAAFCTVHSDNVQDSLPTTSEQAAVCRVPTKG